MNYITRINPQIYMISEELYLTKRELTERMYEYAKPIHYIIPKLGENELKALETHFEKFNTNYNQMVTAE